MELEAIIRKILTDIETDLKDEYDRNFTRQAFFSEAWQRRRGTLRGDHSILIDTGNLRRSIKSRIQGDSVVFYSDLPYASIHNDGGEIRVTAKMKKYFWFKYKEKQGAFTRKKDGSLSKSKRNAKLTSEAEFYKAMALMKVGRKIKIPRRRFLGYSPEVEKIVREIMESNLSKYFDNFNFDISK